MLIFSTILPIKDTLTKEAFVQLVIDWNQSSPFEENRIPNLNWDGDMNVRYGDERTWLQIQEYRNANLVAIRYEKLADDGVVWDSDYVMNFNEKRMSIRLDRSYCDDIRPDDQAFATPAFIRLLIEKGYVKDDVDLAVSGQPLFINEGNLQTLVDVMKGADSYALPVVFVSRPFSDEETLDVIDLARKLRGAAHVLVQENAQITSALREMTDNQNEYNGAVGIYFPGPVSNHQKYLRHDYPGSDAKLAQKVIHTVFQYLISQKIDMLYTWQGANNALLRDRYSTKREELAASETARRQTESDAREALQEAQLRVDSAAQEKEEMRQQTEEMRQQTEEMRQETEEMRRQTEESMLLVDSVDDEIEEMRRRIEELTRENDKLSYENQGLQVKMGGMSAVPVLYFGAEDEFYPGEIKEFILEALTEQMKSIPDKTRRKDALGDIIRSNGGVTGQAEERRKKIKNSLENYDGMTKPLVSLLKELGFEITQEGGNHYKMIYFGDGRYWTTIGCTPSDHRGGKNAACAIIRDML